MTLEIEDSDPHPRSRSSPKANQNLQSLTLVISYPPRFRSYQKLGKTIGQGKSGPHNKETIKTHPEPVADRLIG
nr:hypothetical protein Q903MT_gene963 [Picea sitchensis]